MMDVIKKYNNERLVHPGEVVQSVIQEKKMNQKELALRTGFTEKHISTVISGQKVISPDFAYRLENALGLPASYWNNLQMVYDLHVISVEEGKNSSNQEKTIAKKIKETAELITNTKISDQNNNDLVTYLRHLLGVSDLTILPLLNSNYNRAQFKDLANEHLIYTWVYLSEKNLANQTNNKLDIDKLSKSVEQIKNVMHQDLSDHIESITKILNECGILFSVKKHLNNSPFKGITVKTRNAQVMIVLSIKDNYVDDFWYILFNELYHVINKDFLKSEAVWKKDKHIEKKADIFAANMLIANEPYKRFIKNKDFSLEAVRLFAKEVNVIEPIVVGRLINDNLWPWYLNHRRDQYILDDDF